jgi:hypothetical protein
MVRRGGLALALLLPLSWQGAHAEGIFAGIDGKNASLQYRVADPAHGLEARLRFPAEALVGLIGYERETGEHGLLRFSFLHRIASGAPVGDDTDWQEGEVTVYSESQTRLKRYLSANAAYLHHLDEGLAVGTELFYEAWKLSWHDTRQSSYDDGSYDEVGGETVRFTQELGGARLYFQLEKHWSAWKWRVNAGLEIDRHASRDEHLKRGFYTTGEDWLLGSCLAVEAVLYEDASSSLQLGTSYRRVKGVGEMAFHYDFGLHYMTLPATYTTRVTTASLGYTYRF